MSEEERGKYHLALSELEAKHAATLVEIERLRADVSHWRESRQSALEAGDMLKEENEQLRAKVEAMRKRYLNYRRVLRQLNAAHRVLWGIVTVQAMKSIKPTGHSKLLDAAINKANEAAKIPLA